MSDRITVVATRREDMEVPHTSSELRNCEDCDKEVWVAYKQIMDKDFELTPDTQAICMQCFAVKLANGGV